MKLFRVLGLILAIAGAYFIFHETRRPWNLKAMGDLESWAENIKSYGSVGRPCVSIDAKNIFDALSPKKQTEVHSVGELTRFLPPERFTNYPECLENAELKELEYNATRRFVSGTWRCQDGDMIGEFQLTYFSYESAFSGYDSCFAAIFPAFLEIPVGLVTDFKG